MNDQLSLYDSEYKLMKLIWQNEPIKTTALQHLALEKLEWKKSTTFTMIRKLLGKGLIQKSETIITSLVIEDEIKRAESSRLINKLFNDSLFNFVSTFLEDKKITASEADELKKLIEEAAHDRDND